jgi:FixJ family two-component response regulator
VTNRGFIELLETTWTSENKETQVVEHEERLIGALATLTGDQLYVLAGIIHGLSEREIADELSASRGSPVTRERVHRIKLTATAKLRRAVEVAA